MCGTVPTLAARHASIRIEAIDQSNRKERNVRKSLLASSAVLAIALLGGCNSAKSPGAVANDVAAAEQKSATEVADAEKKASQDTNQARAKVDDKTTALDNTQAQGVYDVAMQNADGAHRVSLEKCAAFNGDAQKKCKDQADADYEAAKADARVAQVSTTR
jgi:hypothetical protein